MYDKVQRDSKSMIKGKPYMMALNPKTQGTELVPVEFEELQEADLTDKQIKMVKKVAEKLPMKDFKKRYGKDAMNVKFGTATNIVKKKLNIDHYEKHEGAREVVESIKAVKNKAEKTGMPYSILKQVYDRGMAAWKGGHRPGATQVQWALARVNSFVTKSSGTWGKADKDLAAKVRAQKKD